jgi:hypothetical protein
MTNSRLPDSNQTKVCEHGMTFVGNEDIGLHNCQSSVLYHSF